MSYRASLNRSSLQNLRTAGIQRLFLRTESTTAESSCSSSSSSYSSNAFIEQNCGGRTEKRGSRLGVFLSSVSGIFVGSSLALCLLPTSSSSESSFSFCDGPSTTSTIADGDHLQKHSIFRRVAPEPRSLQTESRRKYLFRDEFRRRIFFNYEKRIRLRSPPKKVFEYFASVKTPGGVFMTPADFMRAVVPVFPPSESNIVREGFLRGERPPGELHCENSEFFMLFDTNNDGHISFPEYIFFVTLLSIPESSFSVAFKMFDLNNDGEIEFDEFKQVMTLMRSCNRQGAYHRDGLHIGHKVRNSAENGGLMEYFFGKAKNESLQHGKFVKFLKDLHNEILRLEFDHYDYKSRGTISAKDFALSMIASADMSHINIFLDRVDELNRVHLREMRITWEEFKAFAELRKQLQPFSLAIFSYGKASGLLTKKDFQRAASYVCDVPITDNVVDIIFHVFDTNRDGNLSFEEFLSVLQRREKDIASPTEMGFVRPLSCCFSCAKSWSLVQMLK